METNWRYPLENNMRTQEILAEIVSHAITRIEKLEGKDSECLAAEYKEWLVQDVDNNVIALCKISTKN